MPKLKEGADLWSVAEALQSIHRVLTSMNTFHNTASSAMDCSSGITFAMQMSFRWNGKACSCRCRSS